ncbi:MAG TPA: ABC-F family ATP-binding cassette domain-containing protein [Devosia sp.]
MPASVTLHDLSYSTPDNQPLFSGLNLGFGPGCTGLIGRNGTGKSTLLRIIAGLVPPLSGSVTVSGTLGRLDQSVQVDAKTMADQLGVREPLAALDRLEQGLGTPKDAANANWTLQTDIDTTLVELGLPPFEPERPLDTLSGGQRTRLALARLLLAQPDIILLDEPTNNLDAEGRQAVVELLHRWRGAAIVVSHDRALLREMDAIVELTTLGASTYGGNWDHYAARKSVELAAAEHDLSTAERRIAEIDRKIQAVAERKARKDGAGKRKAARGDIPKIMLGGMKENAENTSAAGVRLAGRLREDAAKTALDARSRIEILTPLLVTLKPTGLPAERTVLQADSLTGGPTPDKPVILNLSLTLIGPERVAVTGPNGSGKTTLLRLLTGELPPTSGSARINVPYALLDQTVGLLDPAVDIRDNFRRLNPDADENTCRAALARFMFRADAAFQQVGSLSGGETLRAGLACTIGGNHPPQLLILDEPTNHLDISAIEQMEAGLRAYDGALLIISHDADFLRQIGIGRSLPLRKPQES